MAFSRDWYATPDGVPELWGRGTTREDAIEAMLIRWGDDIIEAEGVAYGDPPRFDFKTNREEECPKTGALIEIEAQRHAAAKLSGEWHVYNVKHSFKKGGEIEQ